MKLFTTDLTTGQAGVRIDNGSAFEVMQVCAEHGALVMVHAEDDDLIKHMEAKLRREGRNGLENVHLVHTLMGEELAVRACDRMAAEAGAASTSSTSAAATRMGAIAEARAAGSARLRRGVAQPALLLDGRLREAGRREVPHRHGPQAAPATRKRCGKGSPTAGSPRSRPTSTRPRSR